MEHIVDLHTHSHYSRATNKDCTLEGLYKWGKIKGITIIGTGDFTHPGWFRELQEKLEPAEEGLYKLKNKLAHQIDKQLPNSVQKRSMRFILTVEIATIYHKKGKVRKLHNLVIVPSFTVASALNKHLSSLGNLAADGRPILGMDSKVLLKMTIESSKNSQEE